VSGGRGKARPNGSHQQNKGESSGAPGSDEPRAVPSVGLSWLRSIMSRRSLRDIRLLAAASRRTCFQDPTCALLSDRPPFLADRVHSPVPRLPFEVSSLQPPGRLTTCPARVSSLIATALQGVYLVREHTRSRWVPSSGFLNLSTAYSTSQLPGLLHPGATSRVSRSGVSPDSQRSWLVARRCLHVVTCQTLASVPAATSGTIDFEALFREPKRSARSVVSLPVGRSPLRFSVLPQAQTRSQ